MQDIQAAKAGVCRDPYRSLALHFNVGGTEEVHEGLDAAGLRYSHSVRIV